MEPKKQPCPSCGGTMTRGIQPETITLKGQSLTYDQPGWYCHDCDDGILVDSDNEVFGAAARRLREMVNGAMPIAPEGLEKLA